MNYLIEKNFCLLLDQEGTLQDQGGTGDPEVEVALVGLVRIPGRGHVAGVGRDRVKSGPVHVHVRGLDQDRD